MRKVADYCIVYHIAAMGMTPAIDYPLLLTVCLTTLLCHLRRLQRQPPVGPTEFVLFSLVGAS